MNGIELLVQRQMEGWSPGDDDGNKLYAAVDGGGMAGVVSLGALHQLGEMGLTDYFDGFAGSSAGSLNAAYAMTGNTIGARDVYVDYLPDNKFMSWKRPVVGTIANSDVPLPPYYLPLPFTDMSVLYQAISGYKPLDVNGIVGDPRELALGVSDLKNAVAAIFTNRDFADDPRRLISTLLDGTRLPYGITGTWNKHNQFGDTGLYWPTTDMIARQRGATHVLSLENGHRPKKVGSLLQRSVDKIQARFCESRSSGGETASRDANRYRDYMIGRFVFSTTFDVENTSITRIYPDKIKLPGIQTKDKKLLAQGFNAGGLGVISALQASASRISTNS